MTVKRRRKILLCRDRMFRKMRLGRTHALHVRTLLVEHFAKQASMSGIIFDQEKLI